MEPFIPKVQLIKWMSCYDYTISSLNGVMIFTLAKLLVGDWCSHHSTDQWGMCMEEP